MRCRNRRREEEQDRQSAQNPLCDDCAEGGDAEPPHPPPRVRHPQPDREHDGEEPEPGCDEPMAVLIEDSADPLRRREQ